MFITVSRTLKRGSKERRDARQKMIFKRERERERRGRRGPQMFPDLQMRAAALSDEIQKERERETKRIYVPLNCSDSKLWTRGGELPLSSSLAAVRVLSRAVIIILRGDGLGRCSRRRFPQRRRRWILCFECQLFLRVHTYTRRQIENNKKQQRQNNSERHRSGVHPPHRRHYPLSPEQRVCDF